MITIRRMTIDDLGLGMKLSGQAGWNQLEADWRRFIEMEPDGCFVGELDGLAVGTTATCVFRDTAWIAMVLVDVNFRRNGVGTMLLTHAIDYLEKRHVATIRLDATSLGQPIYERLGFAPDYRLARFEGVAGIPSAALGTGLPARVEGLRPSQRRRDAFDTGGRDARDTASRRKGEVGSAVVETGPSAAGGFDEIIEFDKRMTGRQRGRMLGRLLEEFPQALRIVRRAGKLEGFITMRPGANAIQIGPCTATPYAGPILLHDALHRCTGKPVFVDVPLDNAGAMKLVESSGLAVQRSFTRMSRGLRVADHVQASWASSGPEKG